MDWKGIVGEVAPAIGTALGGPMAGTAVKFIADKLLGKKDAGAQEVANYITNATPEQLAQLKKLDNDFSVQMRQLDVDVEKINATDRASARDLAIKTTLWPQIVISSVFLAIFGAVSYSVFNGFKIDPSVHDIVIYLLGILSAGLTQVLNFFLGSSMGSKHKDTSLANALNDRK